MQEETSVQLLKEARLQPSDDVLTNVMGKKLFAIYKNIHLVLSEMQLMGEWQYYKDQKAWLFKIQHKTKTVAWLSVWDGYMLVTFYFTDKTAPGVLLLSVNGEIKNAFQQSKPVGKLIPLTLEVYSNKQLANLGKIIEYKLTIL